MEKLHTVRVIAVVVVVVVAVAVLVEEEHLAKCSPNACGSALASAKACRRGADKNATSHGLVGAVVAEAPLVSMYTAP